MSLNRQGKHCPQLVMDIKQQQPTYQVYPLGLLLNQLLSSIGKGLISANCAIQCALNALDIPT